jgi:hypothetical protein
VAPEAPHNLTLYRQHLEELHRSSPELLPDIVIISGDLTSSARQEEINRVSDEIQYIVRTLKANRALWRQEINAPYVLMVPGNHDLDWQHNDYLEKIDTYARCASNLSKDGSVISAIYHINDKDNKCVCWDFGDDCNVFVYLLSSIPLGGTIDVRIKTVHDELSKLQKNLAVASHEDLEAYPVVPGSSISRA